jgi:two-component system, NarL family, response regulator NreC
MTIRLVLVDDHVVVRSGLRMLLDGISDIEIIGEAGTAQQAFEVVKVLRPDVVLMDIGLPDSSGIDAARAIKERYPATAIVALTIHEDEEYFFKMLDAGASGYVPKRAAPEELITAIRAAAEGEVYLYPSMAKLLVRGYLSQEMPASTDTAVDGLTSREQEVLQHLADGASNDEIAEVLHISPKNGGSPSGKHYAEAESSFEDRTSKIRHP